MSLAAFDSRLPADTLEFCPHPNAFDILVCGTYELQETKDDVPPTGSSNLGAALQQRRGECLVLQIEQANSSMVGLTRLQTLKLPAVLDMKWCHRSSSCSALLAIANSEGVVTLHIWDDQNKILTAVDAVQCAAVGTLCLSLEWSHRRFGGTGLGSLVVSLSDGSLSVLSPSETSALRPVTSWRAHDHEVWTTTWNYWNTNIIYSGSDDLKLKGWDIRDSPLRPIFTNKHFDGGVTAIQSHPYLEHIIAVGSYDSTVRLFDIRKPLTELSQVWVGGGVWRLKWHPSSNRKYDLLAACMHDGVKVVHCGLDSEDTTTELVKTFDAHQSMVYGADWSYEGSREQDTLISSCSFYDHVVHFWRG